MALLVAYLVSILAPSVMLAKEEIKIEPVNFRQSSVYILLAFFALIVVISVMLPSWF